MGGRLGIQEKLVSLVTDWGALGIVAVGAGFVLILFLIFTNQIRLTVYFFVSALVLSLLAEPFHTFFDMLRWTMVFAMFPLGLSGIFRGRSYYWVLMLYAMLGTVFAFRSENFFWSLQLSVLFLTFLIGFGGTLYRLLDTPEEILRLMRFLATLGFLTALIHVLPTFLGLGEELRYKGLSIGVNQISWTGGILLPFILWRGLISARRGVRLMWVGAAGLMGVTMLLSMGRAGILIGTIGCGYLLLPLRRGGRVLRSLAIGVSLLLILALGLALAGPERRQLLVERFSGHTRGGGGAVTGRVDRWRAAYDACMESPLMGHGIGTSDVRSAIAFGHTWHNAYLMSWYDSGLFGLLALVFALFGVIWRARRLMKRVSDPLLGNSMRLFVGLLAGLALASFFESRLAGRSNLTIAILMIAVVMTQRVGDFAKQDAIARQAVEPDGLDMSRKSFAM